MKDQDQDQNITLNYGLQRNAQRDYYEGNALNFSLFGSRPDSTTQTTDDELPGEDVFERRFRFDAPIKVRRAVLQMKKDLDLTDREIGLLKLSGLLVIRGNEVTLKKSRLISVHGWSIYSVFATLLLLGYVLVILSSAPFTSALKIIACTPILWLIHRYCIRPSQILRRAGEWRGDVDRVP